ncbi:hypothetical protein BB558_005417 [Smittium angustum]|uniref:Uncharacterized protein n=1 Tax=Smittium angustum TaxID=133377 RepID=A0A2U1J0H8_SMIAN|nr:hypothetical protein BB558_005417 [Smittium angustum]
MSYCSLSKYLKQKFYKDGPFLELLLKDYVEECRMTSLDNDSIKLDLEKIKNEYVHNHIKMSTFAPFGDVLNMAIDVGKFESLHSGLINFSSVLLSIVSEIAKVCQNNAKEKARLEYLESGDITEGTKNTFVRQSNRVRHSTGNIEKAPPAHPASLVNLVSESASNINKSMLRMRSFQPNDIERNQAISVINPIEIDSDSDNGTTSSVNKHVDNSRNSKDSSQTSIPDSVNNQNTSANPGSIETRVVTPINQESYQFYNLIPGFEEVLKVYSDFINCILLLHRFMNQAKKIIYSFPTSDRNIILNTKILSRNYTPTAINNNSIDGNANNKPSPDFKRYVTTPSEDWYTLRLNSEFIDTISFDLYCRLLSTFGQFRNTFDVKSTRDLNSQIQMFLQELYFQYNSNGILIDDVFKDKDSIPPDLFKSSANTKGTTTKPSFGITGYLSGGGLLGQIPTVPNIYMEEQIKPKFAIFNKQKFSSHINQLLDVAHKEKIIEMMAKLKELESPPKPPKKRSGHVRRSSAASSVGSNSDRG